VLHIAMNTNVVFTLGTGSPGREEDDPVGEEGKRGVELSCSVLT
jgi:hypothetical protein